MENIFSQTSENSTQLNTSSVPRSSQTSFLSVVALILGFLSLVCFGFFTGIPAMVLGYAELKGIAEGRISDVNRLVAKIAVVFGSIGTVFSILVVLFFIFSLGLLQRFAN